MVTHYLTNAHRHTVLVLTKLVLGLYIYIPTGDKFREPVIKKYLF